MEGFGDGGRVNRRELGKCRICGNLRGVNIVLDIQPIKNV